MITVTLRFGLSKSTTVTVDSGASISEMVSASVKAILGLPENVQATVDGETLSLSTPIYENSTIVFEKQAAQKAAKAKPAPAKGKGGKPMPKGKGC
jgi:hypothetical protein